MLNLANIYSFNPMVDVASTPILQKKKCGEVNKLILEHISAK